VDVVIALCYAGPAWTPPRQQDHPVIFADEGYATLTAVDGRDALDDRA
jgi:hypothetical protein